MNMRTKVKRRTDTAAQEPSQARNRRTGTAAAREPLGVRQGSRRASAFLARRSLATHRRAWAAVIVATGAAAALIGAFAFVIGSLLVAAPPVQRYAGCGRGGGGGPEGVVHREALGQ